MNKVLKKLRGRNIKGNFKQFLSVIFIVLLATMLFSGFITNSYTLSSSVDRYFEQTTLADLWVHTDKVTEEDEQFLVDNGIEFNKRLYFETVAEIKSLKITNSVRVYVCKSKIEEPYSAICNPYIESGKAEPGDGCLIDKNVAQDHNINAGFDEILFSYSMNINGQDILFDFEERLTGTMSLDECSDSYSSWVLVIEEQMFLNHLKEKLSAEVAGFDESSFELPYNQILIKTDDVQKTSELLRGYYQKDTTTSRLLNLFGREQIESVQILSEEVSQSKKMIYVFPIIFLLVSVLIMLTTIDQLVVQERKRIGILKSCGVPNKKILQHYSFYGAILAFIGASIGCFLGAFIIPEIMFSRYGLIHSIPDAYINLKVPIWWLILLVVVVAFVGYMVAFFRCFNIVKRNPVECLRYDLLGSAKKLKKRKRQFKKLPIPLKMAARNVKIKFMRTVMATIGVAGCVSLLLSGFGMGDTISKSLNHDLGKLFKYDVSSTYSTDDFKEKLLEDERVDFVEDYSKVYARASAGGEYENVYFYSIAENSKISKIKLSGNDVWLSKSVADELDLKVGDVIQVDAAETKYSLVITKLVETSFMNGIYVCRDFEFAEELVMRGVFVKCKSDASGVAEFANSINGTNTATTIEEERAYVKNRIMTTSTMTNTIVVFAVLLAIVVLLNLILLIVKERNIEIATLKVMGLNSWQVLVSVVYEVLFIAVIGITAGMLLGFPLMLLILNVNKVDALNYIFGIDFVSFLLAILVVFVTIFAVLAVSYFKIRKVDMAESLKRID